jgi:hypothetical protein
MIKIFQEVKIEILKAMLIKEIRKKLKNGNFSKKGRPQKE